MDILGCDLYTKSIKLTDVDNGKDTTRQKPC